MTPRPDDAAVTIRRAYPDDARQLKRLAALDSQRLGPGELLVAEIDDELVAAVAIAGDRAFADPFRPTAALIELLKTRAEQLRGGKRRRVRTLRRTARAWEDPPRRPPFPPPQCIPS
ncbi:MAG: hypothetical protein ACR2NB_00690 [Solirubrobacteraceae bacterium]